MPAGPRQYKKAAEAAKATGGKRRKGKRDPLEMRMTVVVRTGENPEDQLTLMNNRKLHMIGSVFEHRVRIQRYIVTSLFKVATRSPRAFKEIAPGLGAILDTVRGSRRRGRKT